MGVQRTVLCPSCQHPRTTKATGRQRLTCTNAGCGRGWLVRDSLEAPELAPAETPVAGAPAPPEPGTGVPPAAGLLGGVDVLPPASLEIGGIAFPEPSPVPASPAAAGEPAVPEPPAPQVEPVSSGDPEPTPPAPVSPGPGRHAGYYGRVVGGRR